MNTRQSTKPAMSGRELAAILYLFCKGLALTLLPPSAPSAVPVIARNSSTAGRRPRKASRQ
jgi:hypothetical protein